MEFIPISLSNARSGIKVAQDVCVFGGTALLVAGTVLSEDKLGSPAKNGIIDLEILAQDLMPEQIAVHAGGIEQRLDGLLCHAGEVPALQKLREIVREHRQVGHE